MDLRTPDFDINDLGFLSRNNLLSYSMGHSFFTPEPVGNWQEIYGSLSVWRQENFSNGLLLSSGFGLSIGASRMNNCSFGVDFSRKNPSFDDLDTRGGSIILDPGTISLSAYYSAVPREKLNQSVSCFWGKDDYLSNWLGLSYSLNFAPAEHFSVSISPDFYQNYDESQWVDNLYSWPEFDFLGSVYGKLLSQTYSLAMRGNYSFTPDMSLQIFIQPFIAIGCYDEYRLYSESKTYHFEENFSFYNDELTEDNTYYVVDDPYYEDSYRNHNYDFNTKSLNWQSVFRWEYRPGSVFFFVWSFASNEWESYIGEFDITGSYKSLISAKPYHKFLIKFNYWIKK